MFSKSKLFVFAAFFSKFVWGKRDDMILWSTEHVFEFEWHTSIDPNRYRTQKLYFYFRSSSLVFPIVPSDNAFCPPTWEFLNFYMSLQWHSNYEIELMALDDESYSRILLNSKEYAWFRVCTIWWLVEYLKNEFFDSDRTNKMEYSFAQSASRMRKLYDDLTEFGFSQNILGYYQSCLESLHKGQSIITSERCGNMDSGWKVQIQWLINDNFECVPHQWLVALNTNLSHMGKILQSKALFIQSPSRLSHAAIVSQEIWKPCFLWIKDIFLSLWHGDEVEYFPNNDTIIVTKRFYE